MEIHPLALQKSLPLPCYMSRVQAGFPSPADDFVERNLDLNEHLVRHPAATFFARVQGNAMMYAGILEGDYLVVDRSLQAIHGSLVLAVIEGEITLRRFRKLPLGYELRAAHPDYPPLRPTPEETLQIWGIVTAVVRKLV